MYTIGIKFSIYWNFGTNFLTYLIEQTNFIFLEQKSILTIASCASYALIHKILILYKCLMHDLS